MTILCNNNPQDAEKGYQYKLKKRIIIVIKYLSINKKIFNKFKEHFKLKKFQSHDNQTWYVVQQECGAI